MALDAWLPVGFSTPDGERARIAVHEGLDWQIYLAIGGGRILIAKDSLVVRWVASGLLDEELIARFAFGGESFGAISSGADHVLAPISECDSPNNKIEALSFAGTLKTSRQKDAESSFHDALFVERISRLLPTFTLSPKVGDDIVFGTWLSGGVPVSVKAFRRLRSLTSWLGASHLQDVLIKGGFQVSEKVISDRSDSQGPSDQATEEKQSHSDGEVGNREKKAFELAGRPELEQFFNEHVVDIIENEARYKALGIDFPSAVILHGPPGCGKTFAAERLVDFLGWPSFQVEASSVASPYIHETSKKVAEVFEKAMQNAPSVLVIDEMEAFLADRETGSGSSHHRVEEVAEFLRRIPEAIKNRVLIIAMTNRIEMIDAAILRRGRFDHIVKVDMASESEIAELLTKLLEELPTSGEISVASLSKNLSGRPLSDVTFVVREGARLAARAGKDKLDQECLNEAMESAGARDGGNHRRIGFV